MNSSDSFQSPPRGCDFETSKAILLWIVKDNGRSESFATYCDRKQLGGKGTQTRKRVQNKLTYWRDKAAASLEDFIKDLETFAVDYCANDLQRLTKSSREKQQASTPDSTRKPTTRKSKFHDYSTTTMTYGKFYVRKLLRTRHHYSCIFQGAFTYELDFDNPANNQGGVIPVHHEKYILSEEERCGKVSLTFEISDIRDREAYKARITNRGTAIEVTRPAFPRFFLEKHDDIILQLISKDKAYNDQDQIATSVAVTKMLDPKRNETTLLYTAPDGMRFSNTKFNGDVAPNSTQLCAKFAVVKTKPTALVECSHFLVQFQVLVEESTERIKPATPSVDTNDFFGQLFAGMNLSDKATPDPVSSGAMDI